MAQQLPIPLALAKRKRCVETSLAKCGDPNDVTPGSLSVCEPVIHAVHVTRRPRDPSRPHLADLANNRYLNHAPSEIQAASSPALLIDILA